MAAQQVEMYSDKPSHHHQQPCQGNAEAELDLQRPWAGAESSVSQQGCYDIAATDMREIILSQGRHKAKNRGARSCFTPSKVKHGSNFLLLKVT